MSHRSRIKDIKAREKRPRAVAARSDGPRMPRRIPKTARGLQVVSGTFDASAAVQIIGEIEHTAKALASGDEPDLWACLQKLDTDGEILCKLDKAAIDAIPRKHRGDALRAFHCALWTWLARHKGILGPLVDRGLVAFNLGEEYGRLIPPIRPIAGDVPAFPEAFIGCLQDIIKEHLMAIDFIPARHIDADFAPPGTRPVTNGINEEEERKECLPLEDYYALTMQALEEVFEMISGDKAESKALAKAYAPYFFIWLGTETILQRVVTGLVEGDPYVRKKPLPDGGYSYMVDDRGPKSGR